MPDPTTEKELTAEEQAELDRLQKIEDEKAEAEKVAAAQAAVEEELKGKTFFMSTISGLQVTLDDSEDRTKPGLEKVRFKPYRMKNEATGDYKDFGLLYTDDKSLMDMLNDDFNVTKITKKTYQELTETAQPIPY